MKLLIEKGADIHSSNSTSNYQISASEFICNRIANYHFDNKRPLVKETIDDLHPIFELFKITKITDFDDMVRNQKNEFDDNGYVQQRNNITMNDGKWCRRMK